MNFIQRCLELASHGAGNVAPNPMVGAVIVHNGLIIGEGFHRRYGEAHAEVNAIASVKDESLLKESTLYVNLEPCSHYGKTPPCAQLIIEKQIPRVVIACEDPFEAVAGRGVKMLREAGIEVVTGVMESEAKALNKYFITAHTKRRPYIILKWAESADGFVDKIRNDRSEPPVKLSSTLTRMLVHKLRSDVQAIMVGTNTAILDNPSLKVSHWVGKSPVRIVFDRYGRIPHDSKLFDGTAETIVIGATDGVKNVLHHPPTNDLSELMSQLYEMNIHSLLVEGGPQLHKSFYDSGLWDEIQREKTSHVLGQGVKAVII